MGHSPISNKQITMLSTQSFSLIFLAVVSFVAAAAVEDKGCVYLTGCNDQVKCCNSQFHCVQNDLGYGNGTCQLWLNSCVRSSDCPPRNMCQAGTCKPMFAQEEEPKLGAQCQESSDCPKLHLCQDGTCRPKFMGEPECHTSRDCPQLHLCQGGTCHPKFMEDKPVEKECVKSYHQGCNTAADCCQKGLMCAHFAGQPSGVCRHWLGAQCQESSDCPKLHLCQDGTCRPKFMGEPECHSSRDCPQLHMCQGGTCHPKFIMEEPECHSSRDCTQLHMCHQGKCKPKFIMEGGCRSKADCPARAVCHKAPGQETGYCKNLILEDLMGRPQDVGCPKCRTVADCPEHAHCGFNGCCQFW